MVPYHVSKEHRAKPLIGANDFVFEAIIWVTIKYLVKKHKAPWK
jgi:hypothetical protein